MDFSEAAAKLNLKLEHTVSLSPFTTWKIGGPARYLYRAKTAEEVVSLISAAAQFGIEVFILGGGSNILVSDRGFDGLVIKMELTSLDISGETLIAGSGVAMGRVAAYSMQHNLSGLEWAVGLPGTVGGAVFGNSNCFGGSTGKSVTEVILCDRAGKVRAVSSDYFNFSYDFSSIQVTKEVALEARFKLTPVTPEQMKINRQGVAKVAAERIAAQPLGEKCAGSTFKAVVLTPDKIEVITRVLPNWKEGLRDGFLSAGFIIDKGLGLKGYTLDNMKISTQHANFFINNGHATAQNAKKLIDFVKGECQNKLGFEIEEEVKYVGTF